MPRKPDGSPPLTVHPLTPERWDDLVDLFGLERGANSGCWCLWPRLARRETFHEIVAAGPPPGLLAYDGTTAVGWVAVGPRASVASFNRSRISKPMDDNHADDAVFAITCFYVRAGHRRQGVTKRLAEAAIDFARANKATALDVCAIDTDRPLVWGEGFVGIASVFPELGFEEVARRSPTRPLLRLALRGAVRQQPSRGTKPSSRAAAVKTRRTPAQ